jgi:hypothetical protein
MTNLKNIFKITVVTVLFIPLLIIVPTVSAETTKTPTPSSEFRLVPACATGSNLPQLDCVLETLGSIAQVILGVTGSLALLMFVYGGFMILSSRGNDSQVKQGKTILENAVIGIVIILLAGYLIRFGMSRLGVTKEFQNVPATNSETKTETPAPAP